MVGAVKIIHCTDVSHVLVVEFQVHSPPSSCVMGACPGAAMRTRMSPDAKPRASHLLSAFAVDAELEVAWGDGRAAEAWDGGAVEVCEDGRGEVVGWAASFPLLLQLASSVTAIGTVVSSHG